MVTLFLGAAVCVAGAGVFTHMAGKTLGEMHVDAARKEKLQKEKEHEKLRREIRQEIEAGMKEDKK